jgi:nucleoside-diphosphate-sugar epimerase
LLILPAEEKFALYHPKDIGRQEKQNAFYNKGTVSSSDILLGQSPTIWKGSEESTREFLYVEDAVDGYLSLIENIDATKGEAFNIGSGEIVTIGKLVEMILSKMDSHPRLSINYEEKDFPEISHQYLDSNKIKDFTGWTPKTKLDKGLEHCIKGYIDIL